MKNLNPEKLLLLGQDPSAKSIITSELIYTYEQLRRKVLTNASYLRKQNISSGHRIGIIGQNDIDFVLNVLALWQLSAVPVPLNWRMNESEIVEQLNLANCQSVLVHKELSKKLGGITREIIEYPFDINLDEVLSAREEFSINDPAVIIFTSGSTNKPKGIILSFNSLYNSGINSNQLLRYSRSDRWLASLPFYHIGGFSIITRALLFGIPLMIPNSLSAIDFGTSLNKWQPTFISLVAAQLKKLIEEEISPNPELKNCLIGGGFSNQELIMNAYDLGWPINIVYGSTETSSFVTALLKDETVIKPNSVGRAVPTNQIQITNASGDELKPFEIGEIAVKSNSLMLGYLNINETNEVIKNGVYYSGDIGYLDDDGYLFIEGRKNYLISTGGENVNPVEVENALVNHPLIDEAAVFPLKDKDWGEIVAASIVFNYKNQILTEEEIKEFLKAKISGFKIPKKIFIEEELPKTQLGKIQKDKLIDRYKLTSL